uniref:Polysaccharide export protein N-terminal domain-containing protein n=1 Tax=Cereibacter sphaeroides (strain ATCC 17025 / ATH 2.4.3) TaxID=349102 RepID=A4WZW1_CERS5
MMPEGSRRLSTSRLLRVAALVAGGFVLVVGATRFADEGFLQRLRADYPLVFGRVETLLDTRRAAGPVEPAIRPEEVVALTVERPGLPANCLEPGPARASLAVPGDRLRIRFFEKGGFSTGEAGGAGAAQTLVFERLDLSGTYEVASDGSLALPLLGRLPVQGRELVCIEAALADGYIGILNAPLDATVSFESRPPVVLRGPVRAPGTYGWTEGLTVARLIASAGSAAMGGYDSLGRRVELEARVRELRDRMLGVALERARTEAAIERQRALKLPASELDYMGVELGLRRIEGETQALVAELDAFEAIESRWQTEVADLGRRLAEMRRHHQIAQEQLEVLRQRREELSDLSGRGVTTAARLDAATLNLMGSERAMLETFDALLALESQLNIARLSLEQARTDRSRRLAAELREEAEEENLLKGQLRAVQAEIARVDLGDGLVEGFVPVVEIERPGPEGVRRIQVAPEDEVFPADLVTISIPGRDLVMPVRSSEDDGRSSLLR